MNFTRNNSTSATAQNKNSSWRSNANGSNTSSWRNRRSNNTNRRSNNTNRRSNNTNRRSNNTNRNHYRSNCDSSKINQFKPTSHKPTADVNNLVSFPKLSETDIVQPKKECVNTEFLDKVRQQDDDIKDKEEEETCNFVSNLPMGWVRLSETNPSKPTDKEIQLNEEKEQFERKQKLVKGIWSSLRHIQKQRDELNDVLGSNSPYYDSYNILGPPGASEDDDDEYDNDYSSDEKTEDDY